METRWLNNTSESLEKLREASGGVCVIPMGCLEKHGLHLPLGQDIIQASHIAYLASQLETACVFADFTFGDLGGHGGPTGSISIPVSLEMRLLERLCEQISLSGFKKILIYNGHGGNNPWLSTFSRDINNRKHDYVFTYAPIELLAPHKMAELLLEKGSGAIPELSKEDEELILKYHEQNMLIGHACFGETSFMMGIHPELTHLDRLGIEDGHDRHTTDHLTDAGLRIAGWGWGFRYPNNFTGDDPIGCNERIGKAAVRLESERLAGLIKLLKDDTILSDDVKRKLKTWENENEKNN